LNYLFDINEDKSVEVEDSYWETSISIAWNLFFTPGHCLEIRAFHQAKPLAGFYDDFERFSDTVKHLSGLCEGIFVTQNPVPRALLSLYPKNTMNGSYRTSKGGIQCNIFDGHISTTGDDDIELETSLVIDVDPIRKAGISATDDELRKAKEVAAHIMYFLDCRLIPNYLACSANGWHVVLLCDPQKVTHETVINRKNLLRMLAEKFNTDEVEVDQKVYNLARIIKLYGTISKKGRCDVESNRLHRISYITKQLEYDRFNFHSEFANDYNKIKAEKVSQFNSRPNKRYDIEALLSASRLSYRKKKEGLWELEDCPAAPGGHKSWDARVTQDPSGAVGFSCFHNRCSEFTWRDFKDYLQRQLNVEVREYMK